MISNYTYKKVYITCIYFIHNINNCIQHLVYISPDKHVSKFQQTKYIEQ